MIYLGKIIVYTIHYKVVFVSIQPPLKKSLKSKSGVYIKFEIHIFATPPFLESYFCPKGNLLQWVGARRRRKFSSLIL